MTASWTHILVPVDFGLPAMRALAHALSWAKLFDAKLTLLHVHPAAASVYLSGSVVPVFTVDSDGADEARARLAETEARTQREHANVSAAFVRGVAWRAIVTAASELACDLIVMGTHGRTGVGRLVLGSVTEQVLRRARAPVLTVSAHWTPRAAE